MDPIALARLLDRTGELAAAFTTPLTGRCNFRSRYWGHLGLLPSVGRLLTLVAALASALSGAWAWWRL